MAAVALLDLVTEALSLIQVYAPGESIPAADSASALFTSNSIIDAWGAEALTIYSTSIQNFNLVGGQQSYTLGPDGSNDWVVTPLPAKLSRVGTMISGIEIPVDLIGADEWAAIGLKSLSSTIQTDIWPEYGAPFHTLWFWPLPMTAPAPVVLYCDQQVPQFTGLSDSVVLPPGYLEALTYELAVKMAPKFGAAAIMPDWLPGAAMAAKTRIKEFNFPALDMRCDPALTQTGKRSGGGSIDFYLGR